MYPVEPFMENFREHRVFLCGLCGSYFSPIFHKTFVSSQFLSLSIIYNLPEYVKQLSQLVTSSITHHLKYLPPLWSFHYARFYKRIFFIYKYPPLYSKDTNSIYYI